jgi:hypothetical protein
MRFRGKVLEGGYELGEIIAADEQSATFRVRVLGDSALEAVAHLYSCDEAGAEEQVAIWQGLREVPHRNLNVPLGCGRTGMDDTEAAYVVVKRTDERLSGVLEERALAPEEAGDLLASLSTGLEALHARGLVHGCLSPEHVLASEDAILLSTECLRRSGKQPAVVAARPKYLAPESAGENITPQADVWCLGATLYEALTQKECGGSCREEAARLALPFGRVLQRALERDPQIRGTLAELGSLYGAGTAGVGAPKTEPKGEVASLERNAAAAPVDTIPGLRRERSRAATGRPSRIWIYAAIAFLIAIAAISLTHYRKQPEAPVAPVRGSNERAKTAWPTRTLAPEPGPKAVERTAPREPALSREPINGQVWRLVLYTYSREADAAAKAQELNEKHPGLNAEAFSPNGSGPYLVVAGGAMQRDQAAQLRREALRMGLPRDAYIQNFRH